MQRISSQPQTSWLGKLAACWAILGFSGLLVNAMVKLYPWTAAAFEKSFGWLEWGSLILWIGFMAYSEGYKGFQKAFAPRFASRAHWLSQHATPWDTLAAPLFCMGFYGTTKKRKIVIWVLTLGIIGLVLLIRLLNQPWRGIIDAGVLVGLSWGLMATWGFCWAYFFRGTSPVDPELSEAYRTKIS